MFQSLGNWITHRWYLVIAGWLSLVISMAILAPPLDDVITTGEFAFLPANFPSRVAEELFAKAFPADTQRSAIVLVVRRVGENRELTDRDLQFVDDGVDTDDPDRDNELRELLLKIADQFGGLVGQPDDESADSGSTEESSTDASETAAKGNDTNVPRSSEKAATPAKPAAPLAPLGLGNSQITAIRTYKDPKIGRLLRSEDQKATLVMVELTKDFMDAANKKIVRAVEELLSSRDFMKIVPLGLDISLSGNAVVGRDMLVTADASAKATELLTVVLVIFLLIAIYRAPLLAIIPLLTVFVSVELSLCLLRLLADYRFVVLFQEIKPYVTVLVYGAGVDYCLFLIARYKEELDAGVNYEDAIANSLGKVGAAITASAGTVICGIAMMIFAQFVKFHEAGIAISTGLIIVLIASLTFTPALLRAAGAWAFWPQMKRERPSSTTGWLPAASPLKAFTEALGVNRFWSRLADTILERPLTTLLVSIAAMTPFAIVGLLFFSHLSYGLLSDLPANSPSVLGTKAVQEHFPAGATGPVTVLLRNNNIDFSQRTGDSPGGIDAIKELTLELRKHLADAQLADIRSVSHPFGGEEDLDSIKQVARRKITTDRSVKFYVSKEPGFDGHLTRLDITTTNDPFARDSIEQLSKVEHLIQQSLPAILKNGTTIYISGSTASIRDLKTVTDSDQIRIDVLVISGVFLILVILLRQPAICLYLVITVLFSYLATLGFTYAFFWAIEPDFAGLDWKVPMFLFTILIAVGEDYNIFLMTRIEEEQHEHGPVGGVVHALSRTGRIISSCGIIMAGTFASLMAGSLKGMTQLGFALAFGVLLDTFVVRTILVPAYLVMLHGGRFGRLGPWLGAKPRADQSPAQTTRDKSTTSAEIPPNSA
ncbi:MMPL family transporter [Planctopirus hydrillae]|uniref:Transporter n=1 Tax=Planctopirus hydrillae TaxID=1841610 RepID=A0A1C3EP30_9PLAN|nr:MMPL family transporter [Planctopirus hydrillae]ODA35001.1 transporter [Planctopirus hydrillae]